MNNQSKNPKEACIDHYFSSLRAVQSTNRKSKEYENESAAKKLKEKDARFNSKYFAKKAIQYLWSDAVYFKKNGEKIEKNCKYNYDGMREKYELAIDSLHAARDLAEKYKFKKDWIEVAIIVVADQAGAAYWRKEFLVANLRTAFEKFDL